MLKLYYGPNACSLASHIALADAHAQFEIVCLDLKAGDQRKPDYLAINPKARVPALVTDRGVLTENPVILGWVAQTYPQAQLKPDGDFFTFSEMQAFNIYLASTVHVAFAHLFRSERWLDSDEAKQEMRKKVPAVLAGVFGLVEERLSDGRPWVCGSQYTVADPYLYVFARWLEREGAGGSASMPLTRAHRERMQQRATVQRILAVEGIEPV
jgi:glutathione S-transferase